MELIIPVTGELAIPCSHPEAYLALGHYIYSKKGAPLSVAFVRDKHYILPRNVKKLATILRSLKIKAKFSDCRVVSKVDTPIELTVGFALKKDQVRCTALIKEHHKKGNTSMVLEAPCGWGKTFQLAYYLWMLQQKTLILVDRTDLVNQMVTELEANTNISMNILNSKNKILGDINICTLQFAMKNKDLLQMADKEVGSVILDECHIAPATKFCKVIGGLSARYRLGLSATPTRSDGLTRVISDVFTTTRVTGVSDGLTCTIIKLAREESFSFPHINAYKEALDLFLVRPSIAEDIDYLLQALKDKKRLTMLYTTSQKVQEFYYSRLTALGLKCVVVNAHTKKRAQIFKDLDTEVYDVLIAGTVLNKGVSIKRLDTCVNLATLTKEDIEQVIGRLRREHPNKREPILIDFSFYHGKLWRKTALRAATYLTLVDKYGDRVATRSSFEALKKSLNIKRGN